MKNKNGFILSTYVYILLVFFLLLLSTMLAVLSNTRILSKKLREQTNVSSGLLDKNFSFVLLGDKDIIIKRGDEYVEPGYKIQTISGTNLSENVKIEGSVDSNTVGNYELHYIATYNGVTKELVRNIQVMGAITDEITNLVGTNGLEKTDDGNVRYTGSSPNNYVTFNDELWRIIGVFEVETASGAKEKLVKIVRNESLLNANWDSSASTVNSGYGVNEWSEADLKVMLNDYYYGTSSTCTYCNDYNQETCINDCTSTVTKIGSTYKEMIEEVVWNTGAAHPPYIYDESGSFTGKIEPLTVQSAYEQERGTKTGNYLCDSSSTYCTDTVERKTEWIGRVGLIYPSDYGYASTDTSCRANIVDYTNYSCKNNNWLHNNTWYWLLSPIANPKNANSAWRVRSGGGADFSGADFSYAGDAYGVRPSIYLKSEVLIESGSGTESDPYKLSY